MAKKKNLTIEDLAVMVNAGFNDTTEELRDFRKDVEENFALVRSDIRDITGITK